MNFPDKTTDKSRQMNIEKHLIQTASIYRDGILIGSLEPPCSGRVTWTGSKTSE
jgi:hypothetical protein